MKKPKKILQNVALALVMLVIINLILRLTGAARLETLLEVSMCCIFVTLLIFIIIDVNDVKEIQLDESIVDSIKKEISSLIEGDKLLYLEFITERQYVCVGRKIGIPINIEKNPEIEIRDKDKKIILYPSDSDLARKINKIFKEKGLKHISWHIEFINFSTRNTTILLNAGMNP